MDDSVDAKDVSLLRAAPGLLRIAAGAGMRTAGWAASTYLRASTRVVRAAANGEPVGDLLEDASDSVREQVRDLLGLQDLEARVRGMVPTRVAAAREREQAEGASEEDATRVALREQGQRLLTQSADVHYEEVAHPAYSRILGDLAPDEARILRLLALEGPQPSIDVRAQRALNLSSELVAPGVSLIGPQAGCRYLDRIPAYLNNLYRLGLIWFSREPVGDHLRYQVLEAQPEVTEAKGGVRSKTVRRSIHLTPFGEDFCRTCLPLDGQASAPQSTSAAT